MPNLVQTYRSYIQAINERDWELVKSKAHSEVIWNKTVYSAQDYVGLMTRASDPAPDLKFHIDMLLADEEQQVVSARLLIRGTPEKEFLGFTPTGRAVEITEHVFYRFEEGKIREVKTVIDMEGLKEQMQA